MFQTNMKIRYKDTADAALLNRAAGFDNIISVSGQNVFYGDSAADTVMNGNALYWEHNGEEGCLWLYHNGLCGHGYVIQDGHKYEVDAQSDDAVFPLTYVNGEGLTVTADLHAGTRNHPSTGGFVIYGALYYNGEKVFESYECDENGNMKAGQIDNGFLRSTFDGHLRFLITLSPLWDALGADTVHSFIGTDFNIYSGTIDISPDYSCISGGAIAEQATQFVEGVMVTTKGREYKLLTGKKLFAQLKAVDKSEDSSARVDELQKKFSAFGNAPMSITELFTLPAPDMYAANQKAVEVLYYLTIAYVADQTYNCGGQDIPWSNWFGMTKETAETRVKDIDYRILDLIEKNGDQRVKDFLLSYAKATLSNSYVSSPDTTLQDALSGAKSRLKGDKSYCSLPSLVSYYLQGDGEQGLSKDPGYCIAMEEINRYVYAKLTPNLLKYMESSPGEWAKKLYDQCCANLQMLKLTVLTGSKGSTEISHKTMMLNLLDHIKHDGIITNADGVSTPITYGAAIYAKVFNYQLSELADMLGEGYLDPKSANYIEMMKHIYGVFYAELQKTESDYFTKDILNAFQKEMKDFADLTQELFIQTCLEMTEAGINMISHGSTLTAVIPKLKNLSAKPWGATCGTVVSIIMYAASLASLSTVFMNWNKATGLEKAEAILICVQSVANIAVSGVKFASIRTLVNGNASPAEKINAALRLKFDGEEMSNIKGLAKVGEFENIEEFGMETGSRYGAELGADAAQNISKFTKFFRVAEAFVRALNVLLMGFIVVISSIEIAKEIATGGWNVSAVMEVLSTACFAATMVIDAVVLVGEIVFSATFSVLPVVGAVTALCGLVFQIVAMFTRKPKNPVVEFIRNVIVSFLNTLDIPSKEWVETQKSSTDQINTAITVKGLRKSTDNTEYFVLCLSEQ